MEAYGPPVDQLLRIADDLRYVREWHDYRAMGVGPEQIPDLIRMAVDEDLNNAESDSAEVWGPIHAWRALGVLRAEPAIPTLVSILADQDDTEVNDWITEELPKVLAMIGPAAIPELTAVVERESAGEFATVDAAKSLSKIAQRHPESRDEVVAILTRNLERAEWHDPVLNGSIVSELIDLQANEAAGVIERAYAGEFVDDSIGGTWYDVWHQLDLDGEPPPQTERLNTFGPFPFFDDPIEPPPIFAKPDGWRPVESRSPDERKERNKARQKLEKKSKGKGGKRR
jgi:Protein of unknown function (DUF1186)